jgi:hypothetical protein
MSFDSACRDVFVQQRQRFGALNFAATQQWNLFITHLLKSFSFIESYQVFRYDLSMIDVY